MFESVSAARARLAGGAVDDLEALLHPVARGLLHPRAGGVDDREHLLVGDVAGAPPRVDPGLEAALGLPQVADPGDDPLVEQGVADRRASGRPRAAAAGSPRSSSSGARMSGPRPAIRWSKRVRESVISSSTGPLIWATSLSPLRITSQVLRGGRPVARRARATCRSCAGASGSSARSRSAGTGACRARRRSCTALAFEALRPAVAPEARVRRRDLVRDVALEHRADLVRRVVDGVALGHCSEYGPRRDDARPSPHPGGASPGLPWGGRSDLSSASRALPRRSVHPRARTTRAVGQRRRTC